MKTWWICRTERGWSLNAERTWHFHKRNKYVQDWRTFFKDKAIELGIPPLVKISVQVYTTFKTKSLQDPGNNMPAVKAAIDGLVDAGVLPVDTARHVTSITFFAAEYVKGQDSVCLLITDESSSDAPSSSDNGS